MKTTTENRLDACIENLQLDIERWTIKLQNDSDEFKQFWQSQIDEAKAKLNQLLWIKTGEFQ